MKIKSLLTAFLTLSLMFATFALLTSCSSSGSYSSRSGVHYGAGYRGYDHRPWGYRPGYIGGGGGIDPDWGSPPVAEQMPEMGMPDFGGGFDMGGFDF